MRSKAIRNMLAKGMSLLLKNECAYSRGCNRNTSIANTASPPSKKTRWINPWRVSNWWRRYVRPSSRSTSNAGTSKAKP